MWICHFYLSIHQLMNVSYRTGLLEENSLFKKSNMFADIEFLICLFACMALYMGSYNPLDCMVSGRKSVFNLIDNPLCTRNYFSLAVYKVISVFSFQEICSDIFVYSVKVCWACWVYRLMFFIKKNLGFFCFLFVFWNILSVLLSSSGTPIMFTLLSFIVFEKFQKLWSYFFIAFVLCSLLNNVNQPTFKFTHSFFESNVLPPSSKFFISCYAFFKYLLELIPFFNNFDHFNDILNMVRHCWHAFF